MRWYMIFKLVIYIFDYLWFFVYKLKFNLDVLNFNKIILFKGVYFEFICFRDIMSINCYLI